LIKEKEFYITFRVSRVTQKFRKKILSLAGLVYVGSVVLMIAQFIDTIVIMSLRGAAEVGIFTLGSVVAGLVQAPQRGAIAASIPPLSKAWKDKDYQKISLIYQRSGINLLIASMGIFLIVWLNYTDAVHTFGLKPAYLQSLWIFFFLGLARIVDLGTGVNAQIIGTSVYWRFELLSGIILFVLITPLSYLLVKHFGIVGAGYSNLISFSVYNLIRIIFLQRKFGMHPFSMKTLYSTMAAGASFLVVYYPFHNLHGLFTMIIRSLLFVVLYGGSVIFWNLSPDVKPVFESVRNRFLKKDNRNASPKN
ncbi:MAG: polysaccharide biosynthesis protein, partial [Bacteroidota bacterium]|nr:polysaccharide biosynthesis protein [Bacteroidota bacterium]